MSTAWFSKALLPWYREHQRALPWRKKADPYHIWLSEVILQQTRVDQGTAYWHRFTERYPDVQSLARATEDEVLRLWQGLGYYSRARNLRTAAQQVVDLHEGRFPPSYAELKALKGVGEYTAAAIGSIAFGLAEPVVDGNVYRVLARVFGIATPIDSTAGKREFRALAATLLDRSEPGDHNQAVMELGALVCTPKNPRCGDCPVAAHCLALRADRIADLPVKANRNKVRERHFHYLHVIESKKVYLRKRAGKDIWQGLFELPLVESDRALKGDRSVAALRAEFGADWTIVARHGPVKHVLSHQIIHAHFWQVQRPKGFKVPNDWIAVAPDELDRYALPRLIDRYLREGQR
ncbi:MAG: A/G-specific adenine glycosylase [Flavobacteriales bacterium]